MKKRSLLLLLTASLATIGLAACDDDHTHTYGDTWASDTTYHWHGATCEHTEESSDKAPHVDIDDNGICDVCEYDYAHEHEFEEQWTQNATHHWHAPTCTHSLKDDEAEHVDENNDGVCDVCLYDGGHIHAYAEAWTTDETQHWHEATCGHAIVKVDHIDENEDNICDVCEYDYVDMLAILDVATVADAKAQVSGGTYTYAWDGNVSKTETYAYGADNYTYIMSVSPYGYATENHYSLFDGVNGTGVFCVKQELIDSNDDEEVTEWVADGAPSRNTYAIADNIEGVEVNVAGGIEAYGLEDLVYALYEYAHGEDNVIFDYVDGCKEEEGNKEYYISFVSAGGYYLYEYELTFTLTAENVIDSAYLVVNEYESYNYIVDVENNAYMLNPEAVPYTVYEYDFAQTVAERTAENPYDSADYLYSTFSLSKDGVAVADGANVTIETGWDNQITFSLADVDLEKLDWQSFEITSSGEQYSELGWSMLSVGDSTFYVYGVKGGEYTLTITSDLCSITLNITVNWLAPTEIGAKIDDTTVTEADTYAGTEVIFSVGVEAYANPACTVAITSENATDATLTSNEDGTYSFTSSVVGTYTITISSTVNTELSNTLTINVLEAPEVSEILSGTWYVQMMDWTEVEATFTPATEGALNGTVEITASIPSGWSSIDYVETATYEYVDGVINLTHTSGDESNCTFSIVNYVINVSYNDGEAEAMELLPPPVDYTTFFVGTTWTADYNDVTYYLTFAEDGTGSMMNAANGPTATEIMSFAWSVEEVSDWMGTYVQFTFTDIASPVTGREYVYTFSSEYPTTYDPASGEIYAEMSKVDGTMNPSWTFTQYQGAL